MCVVHVKYYNHLLAVDMAGVACRGLCMRVVGKMSKDIGMGLLIHVYATQVIIILVLAGTAMVHTTTAR